MLLIKSSHDHYQSFLLSSINSLYIDTGNLQPVRRYSKHIVALFIADLSDIFDFVKYSYKNPLCGAQPKDVSSMFRSLILMSYLKFTSIDLWVEELRSNPLLSILSGFRPFYYVSYDDESYLPDKIPGVGTFYDFQKR